MVRHDADCKCGACRLPEEYYEGYMEGFNDAKEQAAKVVEYALCRCNMTAGEPCVVCGRATAIRSMQPEAKR
jgi:hypothetical protein